MAESNSDMLKRIQGELARTGGAVQPPRTSADVDPPSAPIATIGGPDGKPVPATEDNLRAFWQKQMDLQLQENAARQRQPPRTSADVDPPAAPANYPIRSKNGLASMEGRFVGYDPQSGVVRIQNQRGGVGVVPYASLHPDSQALAAQSTGVETSDEENAKAGRVWKPKPTASTRPKMTQMGEPPAAPSPYPTPAKPSPTAQLARAMTTPKATQNFAREGVFQGAANTAPPEMRDGRPVPRSARHYWELREQAKEGLGALPHDGRETPAQMRARFDRKFGDGQYDDMATKGLLPNTGRPKAAQAPSGANALDAQYDAAQKTRRSLAEHEQKMVREGRLPTRRIDMAGLSGGNGSVNIIAPPASEPAPPKAAAVAKQAVAAEGLDPREAAIANYVAAGWPREKAERHIAAHLKMHGTAGAQLRWTADATEEGQARLREAAEWAKQNDERIARMHGGYMADTGAPGWVRDEQGNPQNLGTKDGTWITDIPDSVLDNGDGTSTVIGPDNKPRTVDTASLKGQRGGLSTGSSGPGTPVDEGAQRQALWDQQIARQNKALKEERAAETPEQAAARKRRSDLSNALTDYRRNQLDYEKAKIDLPTYLADRGLMTLVKDPETGKLVPSPADAAWMNTATMGLVKNGRNQQAKRDAGNNWRGIQMERSGASRQAALRKLQDPNASPTEKLAAWAYVHPELGAADAKRMATEHLNAVDARRWDEGHPGPKPEKTRPSTAESAANGIASIPDNADSDTAVSHVADQMMRDGSDVGWAERAAGNAVHAHAWSTITTGKAPEWVKQYFRTVIFRVNTANGTVGDPMKLPEFSALAVANGLTENEAEEVFNSIRGQPAAPKPIPVADGGPATSV